jgi:hypothetical protein
MRAMRASPLPAGYGTLVPLVDGRLPLFGVTVVGATPPTLGAPPMPVVVPPPLPVAPPTVVVDEPKLPVVPNALVPVAEGVLPALVVLNPPVVGLAEVGGRAVALPRLPTVPTAPVLPDRGAALTPVTPVAPMLPVLPVTDVPCTPPPAVLVEVPLFSWLSWATDVWLTARDGGSAAAAGGADRIKSPMGMPWTRSRALAGRAPADANSEAVAKAAR